MNTEISHWSLLPVDILIEVFSHLSSKERSLICSVSKRFETVVVSTSMKLYQSKYWLESYNINYERNSAIFYNTCEIINVLGDYHLTMRVKPSNCTLSYACYAGNLDVVIMILDYTMNSDEYQTAFNVACRMGYTNIVKYIVSLDDDSVNTDFGARYACMEGHLELAKYLLSLKSQVGDETYNSCLHFACIGEQLHVIKYLFELRAPTQESEEDAMYSAKRGCCTKTIEYLNALKIFKKVGNK